MLFKKPQINWPQRYQTLQLEAENPAVKDFYYKGIVSGETPLEAVSFMAMDFETTGLNPDEDSIISIGMVPFSLQRVYCNNALYWVVRPNTPLSEESILIHHIKHSEIQSAPRIERLLEPLLEKLSEHILVVHFQHIERLFLNKTLKEHLGEILEFPLIDTMEIEKNALKTRQGLVGRLLNKPVGAVRLNNCRERYSLPHYQSHNALTDAQATAELFIAQVAHHFTPHTPIKNLWLDDI